MRNVLEDDALHQICKEHHEKEFKNLDQKIKDKPLVRHLSTIVNNVSDD